MTQRIIEFRAWDKLSKGMRYGAENNLVVVLNNEDFEVMQFTGLHDRTGKDIYEGDILMFPDTESEYVDVGIGMQKVAEFPLNSFFPIEYQDAQFGMNVVGTEHGIDGWIDLRFFGNDYYKIEKCEIIGNIYENPELLK